MHEARPLNAHVWGRHPDGFYVEPYWVSKRLFEVERFEGTILDPACGLGRIVESALKAGYIARGTDIVKRSPLFECRADFLEGNIFGPGNIVCNPPFSTAERSDMAQRFVERALRVAACKVAMLLPSPWLHGDKRARWLEKTPLKRVLFLTPRPSMPPGPVIEAGITPGGGREDFSWLIWERGHYGPWTGGWLRREP